MGTEREGIFKRGDLQFSVISVRLKTMQFANIGSVGGNQQWR